MNIIHLHGQLGSEFGPEYELEVDSAREAIRALCIMVDGLAERIKTGEWKVLRKQANGEVYLDIDMLDIGMGDAELHIIPAIRGAGGGGGGAGKILIGIVMIAAAFFTGGASLAAWGAMSVGMAVVGGALIVNGIASTAAQTPGTDVSSRSDGSDESFLFDGPVNVTSQGGPVYLIYGEVIVGTVVVSSGIHVEDIPFDTEDDDEAELISEIKGD